MKKHEKIITVAVCVIFFVQVVAACASFKRRNVVNALEQTANVVELVCASPLSTKAPEACKAAIKAIDSEYYPVIFDAAKCIQENTGDTAALMQCIDTVDGWKFVAGKL